MWFSFGFLKRLKSYHPVADCHGIEWIDLLHGIPNNSGHHGYLRFLTVLQYREPLKCGTWTVQYVQLPQLGQFYRRYWPSHGVNICPLSLACHHCILVGVNLTLPHPPPPTNWTTLSQHSQLNPPHPPPPPLCPFLSKKNMQRHLQNEQFVEITQSSSTMYCMCREWSEVCRVCVCYRTYWAYCKVAHSWRISWPHPKEN